MSAPLECKYYTRLEMTASAHYDVELITTIKNFIVEVMTRDFRSNFQSSINQGSLTEGKAQDV
jgi:hypothetical protein